MHVKLSALTYILIFESKLVVTPFCFFLYSQAVDFDNTVGNTKYCLQRLLHEDTTSKETKDLQHTTNMREIWLVLNAHASVLTIEVLTRL